jgi:Regulator of Chromosome Condensation (RCC1) repeat protein
MTRRVISMGSPNTLLRRAFTAALAGALSFGLLGMAPPARSAPEGVPVPAGQGGAIAAWGRTAEGQSTIPPELAGKTVIAVAAGTMHSLALTDDGKKVTAWGQNTWGQATVPDALEGKTVTAVAAGGSFSLALTSAGEVVAWGYSGDGATDVPDVLDGKNVVAISAGKGFALALTDDGKVTAWGFNTEGQTDVPDVLDDEEVTAIASGTDHSLALTSDGKVVGWGFDEDGETGAPPGLNDKTVTAVAAGGGHSLALTSDGKVTAWGDHTNGRADVPSALDGTNVVAISAGFSSSVALTSDGKIVAWGYNGNGEIEVPASLSDRVTTAVAAGAYHVLAISTDFRAESKPTISGPPVLGAPLTATPGRYNASPDKVTYQWYADEAPIIGATNATYHPAEAQLGKQLTVEVRAFRGDRDPVVTTSAPTAPISRGVSDPGETPTVPAVKLEASKATVRRGQSVTLSWSSTGATSVVASGGWAGPQAASGSVQVKPTALGVRTYVLTATNAAGTTSARATVTVTRPGARLKVTAAKGRHRAGSKVKITVRGLEAGEKYTMRVGKKKYAGIAETARPLVRTIKLPKAGGRTSIRVTGDQTDRVGTAMIRVARG